MAIVSGLFRELMRQAEAQRFYYEEEEDPEKEITADILPPAAPKAPEAPPVDPNRVVFGKNERPEIAEKTINPALGAIGATPGDLVRGIVLSEVLGPPVSRKRGYGPSRR